MNDPVIETKNLVKDHYSNFLRKRFRALHGLNLTVNRGEAFGLLGPNGAGKTTTQKLLLGLLRPTEGTVKVLGYDAGDPRALERIGFLPENPYFYSYLTAGEFLDFFGQLFKLSKTDRKERSEQLLKLVSLSDAGDKPIRKYSKGMLQRLGIAQCLINDPDLVFLDEPNTGLDPVGRRDIRNIIMQLKQQGKTIFLNSHLLPDVSELCDRVMILHRGRCVAEARVEDISTSGSYHDLEEYFMDAISRAEEFYQENKAALDKGVAVGDAAALPKTMIDGTHHTENGAIAINAEPMVRAVAAGVGTTGTESAENTSPTAVAELKGGGSADTMTELSKTGSTSIGAEAESIDSTTVVPPQASQEIAEASSAVAKIEGVDIVDENLTLPSITVLGTTLTDELAPTDELTEAEEPSKK